MGARSEVAILGAATRPGRQFKLGAWSTEETSRWDYWKSIPVYYHSFNKYLLSNYYCVPSPALSFKNGRINRMFHPNMRVGHNLETLCLVLRNFYVLPGSSFCSEPPPQPQLPFFSPQFVTPYNPGASTGDGQDGRGDAFRPILGLRPGQWKAVHRCLFPSTSQSHSPIFSVEKFNMLNI